MNASAQVAISSPLRSVARIGVPLLLCALTSTAIASPPTDAQKSAFTVRFNDLDVSTEAGAHTLYRRIKNAAESLCGLADKSDALQRAFFASCTDHAIADAIRAVARPELTQIYLTTVSPNAVARFHSSQTIPMAARDAQHIAP